MTAARGRLVVISGPSGAGKTSVCRALKEKSGIEFSVSATTRAIRAGEREGVDYRFLTRAQFEADVARGEFLEWAAYHDHLYGTPRRPVETALAGGRVFLLEIEVMGTRQLREQRIPGLYLFIAPPSLEELRARLVRRGTDTAADIEARVRIAREEIAAAKVPHQGRALYDHMILNVDLAETTRRVEELIRS